jgi:hypothetical protein
MSEIPFRLQHCDSSLQPITEMRTDLPKKRTKASFFLQKRSILICDSPAYAVLFMEMVITLIWLQGKHHEFTFG